jgi:hypothetical protein
MCDALLANRPCSKERFCSGPTAKLHCPNSVTTYMKITFKLDGESGFLSALRERIQKRAHAVVAVAEGAGQEFFEDPSTELLRC